MESFFKIENEVDWYLNITEKEFDWIYAGTPWILEQKRLFKHEPASYEEWAGEFLCTKLWRMNNIYWIINKDSDKVLFTMNRAQHIKYARGLMHPRSLVLKSRQRGISTFTLIDYNDDAMFLDNITVGMQSYGLDESAVLLEKLSLLWESLDVVVKDFLGLSVTKHNTKAIGYSNGSEVRVQTSFRGDTLHRLHVSELGKIANKDPKKARELKTGTLQAIKAGNPVTVESTAEGQHNAFHTWWYDAVDLVGDRGLKDFDPIFLSWVDDPDCNEGLDMMVNSEMELEIEQIEFDYREYSGDEGFRLTKSQRNWFVPQRRELGMDFYQEYPHTPESAFNAVHDGTYYARLWRKSGHVVKSGLYDKRLDVFVAMDLGLNDMMVLIYFQVYGMELRIIDEYHNHGEGLDHYVGVMKRSGYAIKEVVLPHDAKVKELQTNKSRVGRLRELGVRNCKVLKRTKSVDTDIEQVRKAIPHMYIDAEKCEYVLKMMGRYMKQWDSMLGTFKMKPLHNEWSNPADALRYVVMSGLWHVDVENGIESVNTGRRRRPRGANI